MRIQGFLPFEWMILTECTIGFHLCLKINKTFQFKVIVSLFWGWCLQKYHFMKVIFWKQWYCFICLHRPFWLMKAFLWLQVHDFVRYLWLLSKKLLKCFMHLNQKGVYISPVVWGSTKYSFVDFIHYGEILISIILSVPALPLKPIRVKLLYKCTQRMHEPHGRKKKFPCQCQCRFQK